MALSGNFSKKNAAVPPVLKCLFIAFNNGTFGVEMLGAFENWHLIPFADFNGFQLSVFTDSLIWFVKG